MKKFFLALMAIASILAVSCGKDNGGSIKDDEGENNTNLHASLKGSEYIVVFMDEDSGNAISSKIILDLRPDNDKKNLWVWPKTGDSYVGQEVSDVNFYGNAGGYLCFKVGTLGWSGAGFNVAKDTPNLTKLSEINKDPNNWYFHIAYKGKAGEAHLVHVYGFDDSDFTLTIGNGSVIIDGTAYNAAAVDGGFEAGEWIEYEVCAKDMGIDFSKAIPDSYSGNLVTFLSGADTGHEIAIDAIFFYKK